MRGRSLQSALSLLTVLCVVVASATAASATAPGKNGRIVFRRFLDIARTRAAIFTVNPDGRNARQITRPRAGVVDTEPDWSRDGSKIAFERQMPCPPGGPRDGLNGTCDRIYTVRRDGKRLATLVPCRFKVGSATGEPGTDCVGVDQPAWSPDGTKIAFQYNLADSGYGGSLSVNAGIWVVSRNGSGLRQVTQRTPGRSWDFSPQWSPDGRKLVFVRADFAREADAVFTVAADGTGEFQVTPWELNGSNGPDWSPDGQWILFTGSPADGSANVYKVHPDGSGLRNLTKQGPSGHHYLSSSFSPDGTKITTARTPGSGPEGAADVFVMNADGSSIRPVTKTRLWDSGTDWGPRR